jgi:lipopolysaccharide exporter
MGDSAQHSLGTRTARGMLWAFGSYGGGRLLVLISTAVLARLLTPADFGLVALALTFIAVLDGVSTLGLGQALIVQTDEELEDRADTAFFWSIAFGLGASALIAALSPLIASFFNEPEMVGISCALGANFFFRSLGITHYSLAQRGLNFRARTVAEFSDVVVRGIVGIGLAIAGFGAWSLVIGYLIGTISLDIAIWRLVPWRPRLRAGRENLPGLLRFGGTVSAVQVLAAIGNNIDNLFVGRVLGAGSLGIYVIAFMVPNLTVVNMSWVAQQVLFPALATQDRRRMPEAFRITVRYLWMFALPAALTLAVLAEPIVTFVFGDQWNEAVPPMRVLAIYGFLMATGFAPGTVYMALGRPGVALGLIAARLAVLITGLLIFTSSGLIAVAACQAVAVGSVEAVGLWLASRLVGVSLRDLWSEVRPCLVAGVAMVAPMLAIESAVGDPAVAAIGGVLAGAAVYLGVLWLTAREMLTYILVKILPARSAALHRQAELAGRQESPDAVAEQ